MYFISICTNIETEVIKLLSVLRLTGSRPLTNGWTDDHGESSLPPLYNDVECVMIKFPLPGSVPSL